MRKKIALVVMVAALLFFLEGMVFIFMGTLEGFIFAIRMILNFLYGIFDIRTGINFLAVAAFCFWFLLFTGWWKIE